jgi:hypothetical protein
MVLSPLTSSLLGTSVLWQQCKIRTVPYGALCVDYPVSFLFKELYRYCGYGFPDPVLVAFITAALIRICFQPSADDFPGPVLNDGTALFFECCDAFQYRLFPMFAFHFLSSFNLAFAVPFFFKRAPV